MAVTITIAGVAKSVKPGSLKITMTANGRSTAAFAVDSIDGTYRPGMDTDVLISWNSTLIFGGLLNRPNEKGLVGGKGIAAITTAVSASDYNVYAERRYVKADFPAESLKTRLERLISQWLGVYGVTLSSSQVTGPTLAARSYDYVQLSDVLNETCTLTKASTSDEPFTWRIDGNKVLSAFKPSTQVAPFNLIGNTLSDVVGDVTVETARDDRYANRIIVKVPTKTEYGRLETWTGDGVTTTFSLTFTPFAYRVVQVGANSYQNVTTPEFAGTAMWIYNSTTNTITRDLSVFPDLGIPQAGESIAFNIDGTYNPTATAEDVSAATNPIEKVIKVEDIPADTTIQALANSYLQQALTTPKTVKYSTMTAGVLPGQTQTVNISRRNLNTSIVITDVNIRDFLKDRLVYDVTGIIDAQTNLNKGWRDVIKIWSGDKTGGGAAAVPSTTSSGVQSSGPGGPNKAVQFNDGGKFGGDQEFTYDKDTNSLVRGLDSSITAAVVESCWVGGVNCTIADS